MPHDASKYFDDWGLLCTERLDGGDTCNRHSLLLMAYLVVDDKDPKVIGRQVAYHNNFINITSPIPPRHPDKSKWYSDWRTTSRDQLVPYLSYCLLAGYKHRVLDFSEWHRTRCWLLAPNTHHGATYQNYEEHMDKLPGDPYRPGWKFPDPTGPEIWSMYARAFGHSKWVINLWDWHLLKSVEYHNAHPTKHVDKILPRLVVGKYVKPSKNSLKALTLLDKPKLIEQFYELMSYENPRFLAELWEPIINDL